MEFDLVITGGTVIDGSGRPRFQADIGIGDGRIQAVARGVRLAGKVVPFFINQIKFKNNITLTDGEMTRFFILPNDLVRFMLETVELRPSGTYFPSNMYSFRMRDVAEMLLEKYGNKMATISEIGARPGEKTHESLDGIHYSNECVSDKKYISELINV